MPDKLSPVKGLVRMSWAPENLYNLWRLSYSPPEHLSGNLSFKKSSLTLFQQKWSSKKMLRAYHGDWIPERRFRRRFLPNALPPLQQRPKASTSASSQASTSAAGAAQSSEFNDRTDLGSEDQRRIPLGSLMWREVEARLDVLVFRACFTHSVYDARRMITQGHVKLNGQKCTDPNILLEPGDIFTLNPKEMYLLRKSDQPFSAQQLATEAAEAEASASEASPTSAEPLSETEGSAAPSSEEATTSASEKAAEETPATPASPPKVTISKPAKAKKVTHGRPFNLPDYAAPFLFVPAYLEVSFPTCSAIYVRHPTARPGQSEIPTPYPADGEIMRLTWEFYKNVGRRRRGVHDHGDDDRAGAAKELWTKTGQRNWTANWDDTLLEKRHMRAVRQGRGRWAHRPL